MLITTGTNDTSASSAITEHARELQRHLEVPGAAIGWVRGADESAVTIGTTLAGTNSPVSTSTLFRVGSLTKTFVALALAQLADQGRIDLDEPVRRHVPELRLAREEAARAVTLRHLLSHAGGWSDELDPSPHDSLEVALGALQDAEQLFEPGSNWSYSNSGFMLAGLVLERVTGVAMPAALNTMLLAPLGMTSSTLDRANIDRDRLAIGHGVDDAGYPAPVHEWSDARCQAAAIGLITSLEDLLAYVRFQLGLVVGPGPLPSPSVVRSTHRPVTADGRVSLGWLIDEIGGFPEVSLAGGVAGYGSRCVLIPEERFGLMILTNATGHAFDRPLAAFITEQVLGVKRPRRDVPARVDSTQYCGRYVSGHQEIVISGCGDRRVRLAFRRLSGGVGGRDGRPPADSGLDAEFVAPDELRIAFGPREGVTGTFERSPDGSIEWFRFPTILYRRAQGG